MDQKPKYYKKFTIGYNGRPDFFEKVVVPYKDYIHSIYAVPPISFGVSNARWELTTAPKELLELRKKLKAVGVEFNLVYNFDGLANPDASFRERLLKITNLLSPDLVTFSNSFVLDILMDTDYRLNISVIHDINSITQLDLLMMNDKKGQVVSYNIGRRKTYDLEFIKSVKEKYPQLRLKLMVNEGCIFECPDQNFHSCSLTMSKGAVVDPGKIFFCGKLKPDQHWRFLSGQYIPPKFLSNYCDLVDEFKLGTRNLDNDAMIKVLNEYINEEDIPICRAMETTHGGSLFLGTTYKELDASPGKPYSKPYPDNFFKVRSVCKNECHKCNYCRTVLAD